MAEYIKVSWHDTEKTIIRQVFIQGWTLQDYWESTREAYALLDSVPHRVYLISTIDGRLVIPDGFITAMRKASNRMRANEDIHVVVGGGLLVQSLLKVGMVISKQNATRVIPAKSIEEAEMLIDQKKQRDKTLAS